jgi:hypothetical protein
MSLDLLKLATVPPKQLKVVVSDE